MEEVFISYLDENDNLKEGYFKMIEERISGLKIKSKKNYFIIPYHRIKRIKIKEDKGFT